MAAISAATSAAAVREGRVGDQALERGRRQLAGRARRRPAPRAATSRAWSVRSPGPGTTIWGTPAARAVIVVPAPP